MLETSGTGGAAGRPASLSCCDKLENRAAVEVGLEKVSVSLATTALARLAVSASSVTVSVDAPGWALPGWADVALELVGGEIRSETLTVQDCLEEVACISRCCACPCSCESCAGALLSLRARRAFQGGADGEAEKTAAVSAFTGSEAL